MGEPGCNGVDAPEHELQRDFGDEIREGRGQIVNRPVEQSQYKAGSGKENQKQIGKKASPRNPPEKPHIEKACTQQTAGGYGKRTADGIYQISAPDGSLWSGRFFLYFFWTEGFGEIILYKAGKENKTQGGAEGEDEAIGSQGIGVEQEEYECRCRESGQGVRLPLKQLCQDNKEHHDGRTADRGCKGGNGRKEKEDG